MSIRVKRVYEAPSRGDGARILVDRLWPRGRGMTKDSLRLEAWLKDVGPSDALRRWFGHDSERFAEFRRRYFRELEEKEELVSELLRRARRGTLTLLFGASDQRHNQAVVLKEFLDRRLRVRGRKK